MGDEIRANIVNICDDPLFWLHLEDVVSILQAITALQGALKFDGCTLVDVILGFGHLFACFSILYNEDLSELLLEKLETPM